MSLSRSPLAAALISVALVGALAWAGPAEVVGQWSCVAQSSEGELSAAWLIREDAGSLVVEVEIDGFKQLAQEVRLQGRVLTMKVAYQSAPYDVTATFEGDSLEGTWSGGGSQGPVRGKRI